MKKLSKKIFWTLFSILTVFLSAVLLVYNYISYKDAENKVLSGLNFMNGPEKNIPPPYDKNIRFMDMKVYTVYLNENSIDSIISHDVLEQNDDIEKEALDIIKNHSENMRVSNLYFEHYSYNFYNNYLVIVDNTSINKNIINNLWLSIIIFVLAEGLFIIVCLKLTEWITKPVIESFEKQKDFITDASHELKTPLAVIMASSEALERDMDKKWINNILSESERMNKLIISLLDLAKSENKTNHFIKVNLSKVIEKSVLTFESVIFEKNIKLDYIIDKDIEFNCDTDEIKKLMSILIDNAVKHTSKKGDIFISLSSRKNEIEIIIKNKGEAIKKEDEERIFERFYKADKSRNRNSNRYGLGLAIAKNIVTKHKGVISAHSNNGYTTFKIIFKK